MPVLWRGRSRPSGSFQFNATEVPERLSSTGCRPIPRDQVDPSEVGVAVREGSLEAVGRENTQFWEGGAQRGEEEEEAGAPSAPPAFGLGQGPGWGMGVW